MPRRRVLRLSLLGVAALLVTVTVAALVLAVVFVRRPFPQQDGAISLPGLGGSVSVLRDERGVPQIYADTAEDLFRAQGYVQAQDRFFEMDWRRHVTAGRMSELVGENEDALAADKVVRTLGWRRIAEEEVSQADPATRRVLEAYSRGVNDYLAGRSPSQLSLDYAVLGTSHDLAEIEDWTPVDSVSWFKAMAWDLRGNYRDELDRARVYATTRDVERVDQLYPAYPYTRHAPILPAGGRQGGEQGTQAPSALPRTGSPGAAGAAAADERPAAPARGAVGRALASDDVQAALELARNAVEAVPDEMGGVDGVGSNSWVVSGRLTATGKPLLANDPHLAPSIPGIWYQMGLHCRSVTPECPYDVAGYTFAGVPGVVIGHTNRIAWGLTNLGPDVTDFYLERLDGDTYLLDGELKQLRTRRERIVVAGGDPVDITVRSTGHGPLLSDVMDDVRTAGVRSPVPKGSPARRQGYGVSLAWTALTPGHDMDAILAVNRATDFDSFRKAVLLMDVPAQNFVYADIDGHIGYQAPGRIPVRPGAGTPAGPGTSGSQPAAARRGADADSDSGSGGSGSGASGNPGTAAAPDKDVQVPTDGSWPLPGWTSRYDWSGFVPASRLPWMLDPAEGFVVAANQAVTGPDGPVRFTDDFDYGYRSQRIRDLLSAAATSGRKLQVQDMESVQADTRNGIAPDLVPVLLREKVDAFTGEGVQLLRSWQFDQPADSAAAAYFNAVWAELLDLTFSDEMPEGTRPDGGGRWYEVVRTLLEDQQDPWWDDRRTPDVVETRDEIMRRALVGARLRLTRILGKDASQWNWGRLHRLRLVERPLGGVGLMAPLHPMLNRGPLEMPGGPAIVNAMGWNAASGSFDVTWGPSMRMVVDLSAFDRSRWVNQTGASGHPGHTNYADQLDAWSVGESFPWPFTEAAVRQSAQQTLTLQPVAPGS